MRRLRNDASERYIRDGIIEILVNTLQNRNRDKRYIFLNARIGNGKSFFLNRCKTGFLLAANNNKTELKKYPPSFQRIFSNDIRIEENKDPILNVAFYVIDCQMVGYIDYPELYLLDAMCSNLGLDLKQMVRKYSTMTDFTSFLTSNFLSYLETITGLKFESVEKSENSKDATAVLDKQIRQGRCIDKIHAFMSEMFRSVFQETKGRQIIFAFDGFDLVQDAGIVVRTINNIIEYNQNIYFDFIFSVDLEFIESWIERSSQYNRDYVQFVHRASNDINLNLNDSISLVYSMLGEYEQVDNLIDRYFIEFSAILCNKYSLTLAGVDRYIRMLVSFRNKYCDSYDFSESNMNVDRFQVFLYLIIGPQLIANKLSPIHLRHHFGKAMSIDEINNMLNETELRFVQFALEYCESGHPISINDVYTRTQSEAERKKTLESYHAIYNMIFGDYPLYISRRFNSFEINDLTCFAFKMALKWSGFY